ncbi:MAG: alpha-glucan family phosphorylase [Candidatus Omnitrophota bacterium]
MAYSGKKIAFEQLSAAIENYDNNYQTDVNKEKFFGFPTQAILDIENRLLSAKEKSVAYFSMEYGIAPSIYNTFDLSRPMNIQNQYFTHEVFSNYWLCDYLFKIHIDKMLDIPIYGGGLGVLAGDTIKSAADMGYAVVAIGVLWNKGYFKQNFWYKHGQVPEELSWDPYTYPGLIPLKNIVSINTKEGPLYLRLWKYYIYSYNHSHACPIVLLDSNLEQNPPHFRTLTDQLYRSDEVWWKIFQRAILGIGGMKALHSLGYHISQFHLNEGHAAFALLEQYVNLEDKSQMESLKENFYFTCHTPVAAGHDRFMIKDVVKVLTDEYVQAAELYGKDGEQINLTYIALNTCREVNAVAQKHGEVMRWQFPKYAPKIHSITNGIHIHTWVSDNFQKLFDKYPDTFGDWRKSPEKLAQVNSLKNNDNFRRDLFLAHQANKQNLMNIIKHWRCKEDVFTLGWARRIASYKRPALMFYSIDKIVELAYEIGPIQIILAGKAHPNDDIGGAHIDEILDHIDQLNDHKGVIRVMILENYDTFFGKLLTNSVDVWLNNPLPPFEASGTSGMKAILNGVLQMSTLDGWVVEAEKDDIGWIFGYQHQGGDIGKETNLRLAEDSQALKETLKDVLTLYYQTNQNGQINIQSPWIDKMIHCIEKSAFFNTQRMIQQYNEKMWHL